MKLAHRVSRIDASGIRKIFDLAKSLKDPINLSIGQPDFPVAPVVKEALVAAIHNERNTYTQTQGIPELRELILKEERETTTRQWAADQILITSGVSGGLFLALLATIDEGDEVIIPDPYFVMYKHLVNLFGGRPVFLDTYDTDFAVDPKRFESLITPRTKAILLNSPANPTGRVLSRECVKAIAEVCARRDVLAISDEIYRAFAYEPVTSIAEFSSDALILAGHSKTFGMTGWRLGYACGPTEIIQAMTKVQQYSFVCAPSMVQYAALACPQVDVRSSIESYRRKRDLVVGILRQRFELAPPDGAFYLWVKAPAGMTGDSFVELAIANNCLIIPGSVFSERKTHFRICYTVADDKLKAGAELLCRLAEQAGAAARG